MGQPDLPGRGQRPHERRETRSFEKFASFFPLSCFFEDKTKKVSRDLLSLTVTESAKWLWLFACCVHLAFGAPDRLLLTTVFLKYRQDITETVL